MLVEAEVAAGEGDAVLDGGQFLEVRFHELDPMHEAGGVGDLDGQTRAGVEFQEQGPLVLVQDQVHPQVAQPGEFIGTGRRQSSSVSQCGIASPWMLWPVSGCSVTISWRLTPLRVTPLARSMPAPMAPWWRLALPPEARVGSLQHGHHRDPQENDDPDVRHPLVADVVEHRVEPDPVLDQGGIRLPPRL